MGGYLEEEANRRGASQLGLQATVRELTKAFETLAQRVVAMERQMDLMREHMRMIQTGQYVAGEAATGAGEVKNRPDLTKLWPVAGKIAPRTPCTVMLPHTTHLWGSMGQYWCPGVTR